MYGEVEKIALTLPPLVHKEGTCFGFVAETVLLGFGQTARVDQWHCIDHLNHIDRKHLVDPDMGNLRIRGNIRKLLLIKENKRYTLEIFGRGTKFKIYILYNNTWLRENISAIKEYTKT